MSNIIMDKSYNKGFNDGTRHGISQARKGLAIELIHRLRDLEGEKGIGPKTWEKVVRNLGLDKEVEGDLKE